MATAGLVADEDVADAGVVEGVVRGEVRAAGQPEYHVNTLCFETFHQCVDCTHALASFLKSSRHGAAYPRRRIRV
jgi:hypothetical protein